MKVINNGLRSYLTSFLMLSSTPLTASFTSTKAPEKTEREANRVNLESADRTLLFCDHEKQISYYGSQVTVVSSRSFIEPPCIIFRHLSNFPLLLNFKMAVKHCVTKCWAFFSLNTFALQATKYSEWQFRCIS